MPTDEVTIFYDLKEGYLSSVVKAHLENITTAVRANVVAGRVLKIPLHHLIHINYMYKLYDIICNILHVQFHDLCEYIINSDKENVQSLMNH